MYNYIWNESNGNTYTDGWPGNKLTDILQSDYSYNSNAYNVYKVTIPKAYDSIILTIKLVNRQVTLKYLTRH